MPMLLSAALPHHGPAPGQKEQDQMAEAGQLLYKSNAILKSADEGLSVTHEQLNSSSQAARAAAQAPLSQGSR